MNRKSLINKSYLVITILSVFILSIVLAPSYIYGDQAHYRKIYDGLSGLSIDDAYIFYKANLDSKEPGYFFLAWLSSNLNIDKDHFVIFFNVVLSFFAYKFLLKRGGHPSIVFILVSFSYYSYVLFFAAERLKFGVILLLIGLVVAKKSIIYYLLSVITHSQMIIVYTSSFILKIKTDISNFFITFKVSKRFLIFIISVLTISAFIFIFMQEHLLSKFDSYFELRNLLELSKLFAFFVLSCFYAKNKSDVIAFFLPLLFFTLIFGGERVNFIGYFAFLYFSIHYKKGFNFGIILTTLYFVYSGSNFACNILEYGNGYYGN